MSINTEDFNALSEEDKTFLVKGGVIIRPQGQFKIECITATKPNWHSHAACGDLESLLFRDEFFTKLLEFADYKAFKNE